jgi:hypothetical protein
MKYDEQYKQARKRVEAKLGFFIHLTVYVLVNSFLITMNFFQSNEVIWSVWPLVGWGIGLLFHGLGVFVFTGHEKYKEQWIQKEISKS